MRPIKINSHSMMFRHNFQIHSPSHNVFHQFSHLANLNKSKRERKMMKSWKNLFTRLEKICALIFFPSQSSILNALFWFYILMIYDYRRDKICADKYKSTVIQRTRDIIPNNMMCLCQKQFIFFLPFVLRNGTLISNM